MTVSKSTLDILRRVRTSDVTDALNSLGYMNTYEMDPRLRPLFPGIFFAGIATTAEFNIVNRTIPRMSYDEFDDRQYKRNPDGTTHPAALWPAGHKFGAPDEVHVIDTKLSRCGLLGSNNVLKAKIEGSVGIHYRRCLPQLQRVHRPAVSGLLRGAIHATYGWPPRAGIRQPADHMRRRLRAPRRRRHCR